MIAERQLWSAAVVFVVIGVLVAGITHGLGTGSYLNDEERAATTMSTAPKFSMEVLLQADYVLDVKHAKPGETFTLDDGRLTWTLDEAGPGRHTLEIASVSSGPLTFGVDRKALLRAIDVDSLDGIDVTLDDGSPLAYSVALVRGTEWIVFTVDEFSTRQIHFETLVQGGGGIASLDTNSSNETTEPMTNGTVIDPTLDPNGNETADNSTADADVNATDEGENTTSTAPTNVTNTTVDPAPTPATNGTTTNETAVPADPSETNTTATTTTDAETNTSVADGDPTTGDDSTSEVNETTSTDDGSSDPEPAPADDGTDPTATDGGTDSSTTDDGSATDTATTDDGPTTDGSDPTTTDSPGDQTTTEPSSDPTTDSSGDQTTTDSSGDVSSTDQAGSV